MDCVVKRKITLRDELLALKEYDVPDYIIERIHKKVEERVDSERFKLDNRDEIIQELQQKIKSKDAVIDALGTYLAVKNAGYIREL